MYKLFFYLLNTECFHHCLFHAHKAILLIYVQVYKGLIHVICAYFCLIFFFIDKNIKIVGENGFKLVKNVTQKEKVPSLTTLRALVYRLVHTFRIHRVQKFQSIDLMN